MLSLIFWGPKAKRSPDGSALLVYKSRIDIWKTLAELKLLAN